MEAKMETKTVTKRDIWEGYPALSALAKQKDKDGRPWPVRRSWPIGRNLQLLRDDFELLQEQRQASDKQLNEALVAAAVKDREGKPEMGVTGITRLRDPLGYRNEQDRVEDEWKKLLKEPVDVKILPMKASSFGDELALDGDQLLALTQLGVLVYDLGDTSAEIPSKA